jgi:hypothetical protein
MAEPEFPDLASDPELQGAFDHWQEGRESFLKDLRVEETVAVSVKRQKNYYQ